MSQHSDTRRDILRKTGAAVGSGVMIGAAGCLGDGDETAGGPGDPVEEIELIITTADYDPVRYEFGQLIADRWRELGFDVDVNPTAWNQIADRAMTQQNFDAFTLNWVGRPELIDPDILCYNLHHSSRRGEGQRNHVNYDNPEYDAVAEAQRETFDEEERQQYVYECQEIVMEDQPRTPIANPTEAMPYHAGQFDEVVTMIGEGLMSYWTAVDSVPADGVDTLRLGYPSDVNNLNPNDGSATHDQQTMRLIYDRLVRFSQDGLAEPSLATNIENIDETTVEVTIREGHEWHDGEPLTIDDVAFSFEYIDQHSPVLSSVTDPIEDIEVVGEHTIQFNLEEPFAPFNSVALGLVFIIPEHIWENVPEEIDGVSEPVEWNNPEPVGSGPFEFVEWRRDEEMTLRANHDHFDAPNIDTLIKVPGADMGGLVRQLEDEAIDMIGSVPAPDSVRRLEEDVDHVEISTSESHSWYHINYQLDRAPFDKKEIRQSLADAIPKQQIVDVIFDGLAEVTHTPIAEVNDFWHNPDVPEFGGDMERARQRLEDEGYTGIGDQLQYPE